MDRRKLVQRIRKAGFKFIRHGSDHDVFAKDGKYIILPRHNEINEQLAKAIIRKWRL